MSPDPISVSDQPEDQNISATINDQPEAAPLVDSRAIFEVVESMQRNLDALRLLLDGQSVAGASRMKIRPTAAEPPAAEEGLRIIEGVFDGQNMVGPDGKQYSVPANYASKSKLVEGDMMKLTITQDGSFIYKQIGPVERQRVISTLGRDDQTGEYRVTTNDQSYRVLNASVTYFKGGVGDEVVILIPAVGGARWAAIENIIKKTTPDGLLGL